MVCEIIYVGKRRDGGSRFWCVSHHANATAKYGIAAEACVAAHDAPILPTESLDLDYKSFQGGIALWGSVPAVYDTTTLPTDRGIHVHARKLDGQSIKYIDKTYRRLRIPFSADLISSGWFVVDEIDAINYMISSVFGLTTATVICTHCGFEHLDRDWFAVHLHRKHQCHGCGRQFSDTYAGIGNPLAKLKSTIENCPRKQISAPRKINISQAQFPGGLQIWGSNPAILWTSENPEETGIHLHALSEEGEIEPKVDDTFESVTIDGVELDPDQIRYYMAQSAMPHLGGRVVALTCPACLTPHFDIGVWAYTPHIDHQCHKCSSVFQSRSQIKKVISNPFVAVRQYLAEYTSRVLRNDTLGLRPEKI
ncbi:MULTISPECIES: hypothetical protein [Xanthomonas]|uniref:Uncharacterized protein n=1 Tax=Xanthomonas dyei TaxID=743699 RepID=A0ABZ0D9D9_9XANT|nr:hypothetical protein [Xanthomonas dyei]WOB26412.1 hypothetical protein NYR99_22790 [Xanthomonas dyei]WOB54032.1 hypothetical protein NYR95_22795 [Xanthomonas dyei]